MSKSFWNKKTTDDFTVGESIAYITVLTVATCAPFVVAGIVIEKWDDICDTVSDAKELVCRKVKNIKLIKKEECPDKERIYSDVEFRC